MKMVCALQPYVSISVDKSEANHPARRTLSLYMSVFFLMHIIMLTQFNRDAES